MAGQGSTEKAHYWYDTAVQVISNARLGDPAEYDKKVAWGFRAWAMGDMELATALGATYSLLEKIDQRLDRIERAMRR